MNTCLVLLGVVLGCAPPDPDMQPQVVAAPALSPPGAPANPVPAAVTARQVERDDPWLAEDKLQHFTVSFAVTAMLYGGSRLVLDPDPALGAAAVGGFGLGIGKEVVDARSGRWFSLKDLAWDAAGVALGVALAESIR